MAAKVRQIDGYPPDTWREKQLKPRSKTWIKQTRVSVDAEPWSETIDEYMDRLRRLVDDHELEDVIIESVQEWGTYGDRDRDVVYLRGWRGATEQEIKAAEVEADKRRALQDEMKKRQVAEAKRLMEENPELFE